MVLKFTSMDSDSYCSSLLFKAVFVFYCVLILLIAIPAKSSAFTPEDSTTAASKKRANRVALMSAVVPGLGQISNKKYWKLPLIYGGGAVLAYFIHSNNKEYGKFKHALILRNDNDSLTVDDYPNFTNEDLTVRKDYYRRNRDLSYIFAGVLYTLNIVDAYVDSQLMNFDVGDDLTLHAAPGFNFNSAMLPVASFNLVLSFK